MCLAPHLCSPNQFLERGPLENPSAFDAHALNQTFLQRNRSEKPPFRLSPIPVIIPHTRPTTSRTFPSIRSRGTAD